MESGLYADHSKSTRSSGMLLLTSNPALSYLQFWGDQMADFPWDESFESRQPLGGKSRLSPKCSVLMDPASYSLVS